MKKIITLSLNRSGSTFFISTLSNLSNCYGDFEINMTEEIPTNTHRSLIKTNIYQIFNELAEQNKNANIICSKIVLAPQHDFNIKKSLEILKHELKKIEKIIIILRPWYEQFFSKYIGAGHFSTNKNNLPKYMREFYIDDIDILKDRCKHRKTELDISLFKKSMNRRMEIQSDLLHPISTMENAITIQYKNIHQYLISMILELTEMNKAQAELIVKNAPTKKLSGYYPNEQELFSNFEEVLKLKDFYNLSYEKTLLNFLSK